MRWGATTRVRRRPSDSRKREERTDFIRSVLELEGLMAEVVDGKSLGGRMEYSGETEVGVE